MPPPSPHRNQKRSKLETHDTPAPILFPQPLSSAMDNEKRQDESELIAASALDDMRKGAKQSPRAGSSSGQATVAATYSEGFVGRMTGIPLVNSALRVYEQGKASSRVVKYGAQMVESGVKTISKPVINRLPVDVNSLDEFACRQLDRLDRYRRPSVAEKTPTSPEPPTSPSSSSSHADITLSPTSSVRGRSSSSSKGKSPEIEVNDDATATIKEKPRRRGSSWLNAARSPFTPASPPAQDSDLMESGRPPPSDASTNANANNTHNTSEDRQVAQRSRWQTMLLEAGGLSAALSEESMKRLKYCLEWLMFATSHIDAQILVLRDFIASLQPLPPSSPHSSNSNHARASVSQHHLKTLAAARRDIVHTVRQVVDVVSRYAGGALPEPARTHVRGFILQLPQRWAKKAPGQGGAPSPGTGDVELDRMATAPANATGIGVGSGKESVAAAATGGGAVRRGRRAGHRERGAGAGPSNPPSRPSSPNRHSRHHSLNQTGDGDGSTGSNGSPGNGEQVSATTAIVAAQKILTLATESLDMMRGVTGVVKDSLDKADAWVGRLRAVGIERRGSAHEGDPQEQDMASPHSATPTSPQPSSTFPANAPTNGFRNHRHTRNISDLSELDEFEPPHSLHRRGGGRDRAGSIDSDMDGPPSPFYSTSSLRSFSTLGSMETMSVGTSTTGSENGNSIPSTPGASYVLPPSHLYQSTYPSGPYAPGSGYGRSSNLAGPGVYASGSSSGAPSPPNGGGANQLGLGLGSMRIDSRGGSVASTPKSVLGRELDDEDEGVIPNVKIVNGGNADVKVVGMDVELVGGEGREGERMDIDS